MPVKYADSIPQPTKVLRTYRPQIPQGNQVRIKAFAHTIIFICKAGVPQPRYSLVIHILHIRMFRHKQCQQPQNFQFISVGGQNMGSRQLAEKSTVFLSAMIRGNHLLRVHPPSAGIPVSRKSNSRIKPFGSLSG